MSPRRKDRLTPTRCRWIFGTGFVAFLAMQLAGGEIIDRWHPEVRCRDLAERLAEIRSLPKTPDLVYFGSSRFASGIDPVQLTVELRRELGQPDFRVAGAAVPGTDIFMMEKILDEMDRLGIQPPTLLIEVTPFNLLRVNGWYALHLYRWMTWSDIPEHFHDLTMTGDFGRMVTSRTMPLWIHRYHILKTFWGPPVGGGLDDIADDEEIPADYVHEADIAKLLDPSRVTPDDIVRCADGLGGVERHYRRFPEIGGRAAATLERILTRCAQKGTRVILVSAPLSSAHRQASAPSEEAYFKYMHGLETKFGTPFVNCHSLLPDTLLRDHHHLKLPEGGMVLTRYLSHEYLPPLLKGSSPPIRFVNRERNP